MKIAFCVYGYSPETELLQPWLTVHEVASVLIAEGWEVHLVTDVDRRPTLAGMQHHYVRTMRPSNAGVMSALMSDLSPDRVVVLTTPLNLMFSGWYGRVDCPLIAFLSYPFYTLSEVIRALRHLRRDDLITFGRHVLVPKFLWTRTLRKFYSAVIAQSARTANRVAHAAGPDVQAHALSAGVDLQFWKPAEPGEPLVDAPLRFLYVGAASAIRGFNVLLDAVKRLKSRRLELKVLARGSTPDEVAELERRIRARTGGMAERIQIVGGWMDRERYREELRSADVVVLPFVLVPSELPVSVIESIACGTPVITTDIDGLPDAVGAAGLIVRSGSVAALASAMDGLAINPERLEKMRTQCTEVRIDLLDWTSVGHEWQKVLSS